MKMFPYLSSLSDWTDFFLLLPVHTSRFFFLLFSDGLLFLFPIFFSTPVMRNPGEPPGGQGEMEHSGGPHSDSGSISPTWERDRRGPPPGPPGPLQGPPGPLGHPGLWIQAKTKCAGKPVRLYHLT